jgi:hypothetical protein
MIHDELMKLNAVSVVAGLSLNEEGILGISKTVDSATERDQIIALSRAYTVDSSVKLEGV